MGRHLGDNCTCIYRRTGRTPDPEFPCPVHDPQALAGRLGKLKREIEGNDLMNALVEQVERDKRTPR